MDMSSKSAEVMNPNSLDNNSRVSSSLADPRAMYKNCCNSLSDRLAEPSAMFTGIDVQALLICEVRPNLSSGGNFEVSAYSFLTTLKLCFQTSKFWCGFIAAFFMKSTIILLNREMEYREIASEEMETREIGNKEKGNREVENRRGAKVPIQSISNYLFPITRRASPINFQLPILHFNFTNSKFNQFPIPHLLFS